MAKEMDIFVRRRIHECDLIVTSLTYRDGLSVASRLLLESCIKEYTLTKAVAAETDMGLVAHIDQMLKTAYLILHQSNEGCLLDYLETRDGESIHTRDGEELMTICRFPSLGMEFLSRAAFSSRLYADFEDSQIDIGCSESFMATLKQYFGSKVGIALSVTDLSAVIEKFAGYANSAVELKHAIDQTLKYALERYKETLSFSTDILGEHIKKFLETNAATELMANVLDLCYRFANTGSSTVELAALVIGTELHFSFGRAFSNMAFGTQIAGSLLYKAEAPESVIELNSKADASAEKYISIENVAAEIALAVEPILKRHRLLAEMDADKLDVYDDMALEDAYYVIIQEKEAAE